MSDPSRPVHDLVIVGSGPAGLTAATYAARAGLAPVLVEGVAAGGPAGGQLTLTTDVENYPGFPQGIMGPQLIQDMRGQAERFGTGFITDDVTDIDLDQRPFRIATTSNGQLFANALILATGARPRRLEVPGEQALWGAGVSACATCDGFFFRDKDVVVVGGGDSAMEEAAFLTRFAVTVTVVHRRGTLRASQILQDRVFELAEQGRVRFAFNATVAEICGRDGTVTGVVLADTAGTGTRALTCDGVFLAIGHIPNTSLVAGALATDEHGYLVVEPPSTATSVPGVFAAGDVADPTYRQAVTAAGSGCRAALDVQRWLADRHG